MPQAPSLPRRGVLAALGTAGLALPLAGFAPMGADRRAFEAMLARSRCLTPLPAAGAGGATRKLTIAWNATSICTYRSRWRASTASWPGTGWRWS